MSFLTPFRLKNISSWSFTWSHNLMFWKDWKTRLLLPMRLEFRTLKGRCFALMDLKRFHILHCFQNITMSWQNCNRYRSRKTLPKLSCPTPTRLGDLCQWLLIRTIQCRGNLSVQIIHHPPMGDERFKRDVS